MIKRTILPLLLIIVFHHGLFSQESNSSVLDSIENNELLFLQMPPLEKLFEGARKSSMVEFFGHRMEGQELALKTERRRWLSYFSVYGSYQYGVMGINSYSNIGADMPIIYEYSAGSQLWYNVGASVRIPLDQLFDRRNKIRTQQLKIAETVKEQEMWYDEQKTEIIKLYYEAQKMLNTLKFLVENYQHAATQYDIMQQEYLIGNINMQGLATSKSMHVQAFIQLEEAKSLLKIVISQLEILSNTKILKG
ncbi:MAG: TolC family protein [Bacteroidales bacterium]|jgi:hypothetical protein|nr:TolC family protein [Bacteroidales bacterium]